MSLPSSLSDSLDKIMNGLSTQQIAKHYSQLSERYRLRQGEFQIANQEEAIAYSVARMPATYSVCSQVFKRLKIAFPDFLPSTLLDAGAGPGTASLAAIEAWDKSFSAMTLLEPNQYLADISKHFIPPLGIEINHLKSTIDKTSLHPHDIVVSSYVLNELPGSELERHIEKLWHASKQAFVLIEPGTPLGYEVILRARDLLLDYGAYLAAPCPHSASCPLAGSEKWCHFSIRLNRSVLHRKIKNQEGLGYEDEKFSYLIATRESAPQIQYRVIGHPHGTKITDLEVCSADAQAMHLRLSKKDFLYKAARKAAWGDSLGKV